MAVLLKDVVDNMDLQGDVAKAYLNPKTGKFVMVTADYYYILDGEDEDLDEEIEEETSNWEDELVLEIREVRDSGDYLLLPDRYEIDEYGIMQDFCASVKPAWLRQELLDKIHGTGAFQRFKDAILERGIEKQWYAYRQEALEAVAIHWLHVNQIEYTASEDAG